MFGSPDRSFPVLEAHLRLRYPPPPHSPDKLRVAGELTMAGGSRHGREGVSFRLRITTMPDIGGQPLVRPYRSRAR